MHDHYGCDKYSSFGSGSFAKHTATNVKFDLDLVEPFKRNSFGTLQEMFDSVHDFLAEEYKNTGVTIRRQKVSIGVSFPIEEGDEKPVELDVVPGRELSDDNYLDSHDLNLCFNEDHWGFQRDQARKRISRSRFRISKVSRVNVKLFVCLKYGKAKDKKYKSFVIELAVIRALDGYNGDMGLWPRLKYTMEYLRDHIAESSFHLLTQVTRITMSWGLCRTTIDNRLNLIWKACSTT